MTWTHERLSEFCSIKHGFAFKSAFFTESGQYVLMTPGHFKESGGFREARSGSKFYEGEFPPEFILKENDLLVVMTEQKEGLLGSTALIPISGRYLHNQRLGLISNLDEGRLSRQFLFHLLNNPPIRRQISETAGGTKVRHSSPKKILSVEFQCPPLPEQRKIAEILSTWDRAIELTEKMISAKQKRKQALMQKLLTGKVRLPEFQKGDQQWLCQSLSDGILLISGRHIPSDRCSTAPSDTPYLTGPDDFRSGSIKVTKYARKPDVVCEAGDILITVKGSGTGKVVRADTRYCISRQLMAVRAIHFDGDFVEYVLRATQARFNRNAAGLIPGISRTDILNLQVLTPPMHEQARIAAILSAADAEIKLLQEKTGRLKQQKKGLMQQLLTGKTRVKIDADKVEA